MVNSVTNLKCPYTYSLMQEIGLLPANMMPFWDHQTSCVAIELLFWLGALQLYDPTVAYNDRTLGDVLKPIAAGLGLHPCVLAVCTHRLHDSPRLLDINVALWICTITDSSFVAAACTVSTTVSNETTTELHVDSPPTILIAKARMFIRRIPTSKHPKDLSRFRNWTDKHEPIKEPVWCDLPTYWH